MRKAELKNCPQWLLDADTEKEDVDFNEYGILIWRGGDFRGGDFRGGNFLGGDFRGGDFRGGNFLGGDFLGGNFWGGDFRGGDFWGGNFRGGDFRGGNFLGGNFLGGDFRGGNFLGGNFLGGNFLGGNFMGDAITRKPISIYGLRWPVVIVETQMQIGCQTHRHEEWASFSDGEISRMSDNALEFWKENKAFLMSICNYEASFRKIEK